MKTGLTEEGGELFSPALYLKKHFNEEIGRILTASFKHRTAEEETEKTPLRHKEKHLAGGLAKPTDVEVKGIQFAYNNHEIIDVLKKRGAAIAGTKWEDVTKFDNQLSEMVKNEANYEKFTTPVVAFVTFESDDGQVEALSFSKQHHWYDLKDRHDPYKGFKRETILGERAHFIAATEPTNIQWENRHIKGINYKGRVLAAILIVLFLLAISFFTIVSFKKSSIKSSKMFPEVDMHVIQDIFAGNKSITFENGTLGQITNLQHAAYKEWKDQDDINWGDFDEVKNPDVHNLITKKLNGPL